MIDERLISVWAEVVAAYLGDGGDAANVVPSMDEFLRRALLLAEAPAQISER